jgi:hypothetical protein
MAINSIIRNHIHISAIRIYLIQKSSVFSELIFFLSIDKYIDSVGPKKHAIECKHIYQKWNKLMFVFISLAWCIIESAFNFQYVHTTVCVEKTIFFCFESKVNRSVYYMENDIMLILLNYEPILCKVFEKCRSTD